MVALESWWSTLIFGVLVSFVARYFIEYFKRLSRLPPGPWGLPLVGYLPWVKQEAHLEFIELGKKYGGIFSVRLGYEMFVVLNDWKSVQETLLDKQAIFSGRPTNAITHMADDYKTISFSEGSGWKANRKIGVQCLRSIGMGTKAIEDSLYELNHSITEEFVKFDNKTADVCAIFNEILPKFSWKLLASVYDYASEEEISELKRSMSYMSEFMRSDNPIFLFTWLRFLPPNGFGAPKFSRCFRKTHKLIDDIRNKHGQNSSSNRADAIDYYLEQISKRQDHTPPFTHEWLSNIMFDLLIASIETTSSSALWGLLYLGLHPEVQKRAQQELDSVVGQRSLDMDDLPSLPYLSAFVSETMRFSSVVPLSLPHKTTEATEVCGYQIPEGTTCFQNIFAIHFDPQIWDQPLVFNPQRFLTSDGAFKAPPYFMPFSVGPRKCIGQPLADVQLRLVLGNIIHRFQLSFPDNKPPPSLKPTIGIVLHPPHYKLNIQTRF